MQAIRCSQLAETASEAETAVPGFEISTGMTGTETASEAETAFPVLEFSPGMTVTELAETASEAETAVPGFEIRTGMTGTTGAGSYEVSVDRASERWLVHLARKEPSIAMYHLYIVTPVHSSTAYVMHLPPQMSSDSSETPPSFLGRSDMRIMQPPALFTWASPDTPAVVLVKFTTAASLDVLLQPLREVALWFDTLHAFGKRLSHLISPNVEYLLCSREPLLRVPSTGTCPAWTTGTLEDARTDLSVCSFWKRGDTIISAAEGATIPPTVATYLRACSSPETMAHLGVRRRLDQLVRHHSERMMQTVPMQCTRGYRATSISEETVDAGDLLDVGVDTSGRVLVSNGWVETGAGKFLPAYCFTIPNDAFLSLRPFVNSRLMGVRVTADGDFVALGTWGQLEGWTCGDLSLTQQGVSEWIARAFVGVDARGSPFREPVVVEGMVGGSADEAVRLLYFVWCDAVSASRRVVRRVSGSGADAWSGFDDIPHHWPCADPTGLSAAAASISERLLHLEAELYPIIGAEVHKLGIAAPMEADTSTRIVTRGSYIAYILSADRPEDALDYEYTQVMGFNDALPCWLELANMQHADVLVDGNFHFALYDPVAHVMLTDLAHLSRYCHPRVVQ